MPLLDLTSAADLVPALRLVIIESPLGSRVDGTKLDLSSPEGLAEFERNQAYARRAMLDSLRRGEAPFASHVLYPLVLSDAKPEERKLGMAAGFAWAEVLTTETDPGNRRPWRVVYVDYGTTPGMQEGIERARALGQRIEYRRIGRNEDLMASYEADNPHVSSASGGVFGHHPGEV